ncbi:hypothetical protein B0H67DRAFT_648035 [Lasiosphaeris hirsuta]|uniref:Retrotransposon Copia-like N-terminal domain-containing protein n=1 Tax=Lasiosphaeris hirsuta TaxID=260670 RepID=A0AA40A2K3_9PEZI|nr:hypothetical protein B0H67DRAFT_648035 [Lasiosphaeris hirsuta]
MNKVQPTTPKSKGAAGPGRTAQTSEPNAGTGAEVPVHPYLQPVTPMAGVCKLQGSGNFRIWNFGLLKCLESQGLLGFVTGHAEKPEDPAEEATYNRHRALAAYILNGTITAQSVMRTPIDNGWDNVVQEDPKWSYDKIIEVFTGKTGKGEEDTAAGRTAGRSS